MSTPQILVLSLLRVVKRVMPMSRCMFSAQSLVRKVFRDRKAQTVFRAFKVCRAHKVSKVFRAFRLRKEPLVFKVFRV